MWFYNNIPRNLPKSKGPYTPGCMDVMLEYSLSGVFMRLYYPTNAKREESNRSKWVPWFPNDNYLIGMAKAIMISVWGLRLVRWWYSANNILVPSLYGEKVKTDNKLKCIIVSHGYASNRFLYSVLCNELASRGYLVAAIEHRDHSACYTYYYKSKEDAILDIRTHVDVKIVKFGSGHYETRNQQVHQRADECSKLLDFLINLNNGIVPHNIINDIKTGKEINFDLKDLVGKLDLENLLMAGHSFGGATALLTLSKRKELKQGIILDAWMFPIKSEENLIKSIDCPLLFINTQTFHIMSNIALLEEYLTTNGDRHMFTLLHTTHESQTDSVCVMGYWLNWFMKKLDPTLALNINNAIILRFLKQYTGHSENIEDFEMLLQEQDVNVAKGLTKPWA